MLQLSLQFCYNSRYSERVHIIYNRRDYVKCMNMNNKTTPLKWHMGNIHQETCMKMKSSCFAQVISIHTATDYCTCTGYEYTTYSL